MRPFEGVKILDCTHVLAGPFTAYQLAVLGADVIKVDDPNEPDQSRESGSDMAMLDVALILQASHITDYLHSGRHSKRAGNKMRFAESSMHEAKDGLVQLAPSNGRQHRRFYAAIDEPAEAARCTLDERYARYEEKHAAIAKKMKEKTADEWEHYLQSKQVPATRVRELREALQDPQLKHRAVLHQAGAVA